MSKKPSRVRFLFAAVSVFFVFADYNTVNYYRNIRDSILRLALFQILINIIIESLLGRFVVQMLMLCSSLGVT
jgi:hypothetical protein